MSSPLRIAIDCRSLAWQHSGIARYLRNVLRELTSLDKANKYYLLNYYPQENIHLPENFEAIIAPPNILIYKFIWTPYYLLRNKIDVYWSPTQELPLIKMGSCRYISTIHDVAFKHKGVVTSINVRVFDFLGIYKRSTQLADVIFTDSEFSKQDIARIYNKPPDSIVVTYLGVESIFRPVSKEIAREYTKNHFDITKPYIFYINTGRPRNLLHAFSLFKQKFPNSDIFLVTLGRSAVPTEDLQLLIAEYGLESYVSHINKYATDIDLLNLYAGANFFVCPSFFEGFGLTPLEALTCGTRILISNTSCLPEIFGELANYCNPHDVSDIRNQLNSMYNETLGKNSLGLLISQKNKSKI